MKHFVVVFGLIFLIQMEASEREEIVQTVRANETTSICEYRSVLPGIHTNLNQSDIDRLLQADRQKLLALRNYTYGCPTKEVVCCGYGNVVVTKQEHIDLKDVASRNNWKVETNFRYGACHRGCGIGVAAVTLFGGCIVLFGGSLIGMLDTVPIKVFEIYMEATGGSTVCAACLTGCAECRSCSFKGCCDDAYTVISITK